MNELVALLSGREIGRVRKDRHGRLSFTYDESWRQSERAYPLSLSMPLGAATHPHGAIDTFLWGLLPDNDAILKKWAQKFQVSARNAFGLIANVGEDCAGAVQFVRPDRLSEVADKAQHVEWLNEEAVAERLKALRDDLAAWRVPRDTGQFSLAGAQAKTALLFQDGRWGVPSGRTPTTHILKPPTPAFDGHVENEHFCLGLSRALGLPTALSRVARFKDEIAICVERYDRVWTDGGEVVRVHQEDTCQSLSVHPADKYEKDGGPGAVEIVRLLRDHSSNRDADISTLASALVFNWLIAGTDAHAKNYSVLIGADAQVRLAPLYDIASALPYDDLDINKLKLAMRVGGEYRLRDIGARNWWRLAEALRLDRDIITDTVRGIAQKIPDEAAAMRTAMADDGLAHRTIDRLVDRLVPRAAACVHAFELAAA
jgi:serine/threonine-protein kinase HipA